MTAACAENNLQPKTDFLEKCIQLFETIMVRHGLMVVGGAFSGKSKIIKVLQDAFSSIKDHPDFITVLTYFINPKSVLQTQLYGMNDKDTGEWTDGVLAIKIRDCAESTTQERKWLIFDGPVDAVWIENMNTVLDDNKKLCLNSGQIIKLKPTMTMMFEVEDLTQASPATISRCGMVLLEPQQLGFTPLIQSYVNYLSGFIDEKVVKKISKVMHYFCNLTTEFVRLKSTFPVPTGSNFLVHNFLNIFDTFVMEYKDEENPVPTNIEEISMNAIVFAAIWGIGGQIEENTRGGYDEYLRKLIAGEPVQTEFNIDVEDQGAPIKIPNKLGSDYETLFDMSFQAESCSWVHWLKTQPTYQVPVGVSYTEVIVPTVDSIRVQYLLKTLLMKDKHTLIVGPTGTGKSITIVNELKLSFQSEAWTYLGLSFSAQTTAAQTQLIIDGGMEKKRKGVYGPPLGKEGIIFVDDLNMPQKEKYGAQPPIELLRQWMDYGGWYDFGTPDRDFRATRNVRFCAAMGPPGGGRTSITNRYVRHFNIVYVEPYSVASMNAIYGSIMDWMYRSAIK
jgi:dynein heavy chain